MVGATVTSVAICSGGRCATRLDGGSSRTTSSSAAVQSSSAACVTEDGVPWYEQVPLNTFQADEHWFHRIEGAESAEFPAIDHYGFCVAVCRSEGFDSGAFSTNRADNLHCVCYHSADITCLLRYGDNVDVNSVAGGTLFTPKALNWCTDQDFCDVHPSSRICFTGHQWSIQESWPWLGGDWDFHYVDSATVRRDNDCFDFCADYEGVITTPGIASSKDNCFCFDTPICMIDWGEQVDKAFAASGTFSSKQQVEPCSFDLCEQDPTNSFCYTNNKFSGSSYQFEGNLTASTTQDIEREFSCLDFCSGQDAAVYYDDSCECYANVTCVTTGTSTFTSMFTLEPVSTCD